MADDTDGSQESPDLRRTGRGWVWYSVSVLGLALGSTASAVVLANGAPGSLTQLDPPATAVTAPVTDSGITHAADAALVGTYDRADPVLATGLAGTVTAIAVEPGSTVVSGTALYSVDGVQVRAYRSESPLFRPLAPGAKGSEVTQLQVFLSEVLPENRVEPDGSFGQATKDLVLAYERAIGVAQPTGTFSPEWLAWLPAPEFVVEHVGLAVGAPAPGVGAEALRSAVDLMSITLEGADGDQPDGGYVFAALGREVTLDRVDGAWEAPDANAARELLDEVAAADGVARVEGRVRLASPLPGQAVPAAALIASADGDRYCVVLTDETGQEPTYLARPVRVQGSDSAGSAVIDVELDPGSQVLLNARAVSPDAECP